MKEKVICLDDFRKNEVEKIVDPVICLTFMKNGTYRKIFASLDNAVKWFDENFKIRLSSIGIKECCTGKRAYYGKINGIKLKWKLVSDLNKKEIDNFTYMRLSKEERRILKYYLQKSVKDL